MDRYYFPGNEYHTDVDKLSASVRSYPGSRLSFTMGILGVIFDSRRKALDGVYNNEAWCEASINMLNTIERAGGVVHVTGIDNIRKCKGPAVFIGNHMSTLETFVLPILIQPVMDVTFVVKDSLVENKIFGPIMRSRDPIVVSRKNSREDLNRVLTEGSEKLANGCSVIIFPQSTRKEYFSPREFNSLGIKLASRNGAEAIPVAIRSDFWKNGKLVKDLGPIQRDIPVNIAFGEPVRVEGSGKNEHNMVVSFIKDHLVRWGVHVIP